MLSPKLIKSLVLFAALVFGRENNFDDEDENDKEAQLLFKTAADCVQSMGERNT